MYRRLAYRQPLFSSGRQISQASRGRKTHLSSSLPQPLFSHKTNFSIHYPQFSYNIEYISEDTINNATRTFSSFQLFYTFLQISGKFVLYQRISGYTKRDVGSSSHEFEFQVPLACTCADALDNDIWKGTSGRSRLLQLVNEVVRHGCKMNPIRSEGWITFLYQHTYVRTVINLTNASN